MELFGDGTQSRDFTYVDDIAHGTIAALKPVGYEIFNLGGGNNPVSLNWIIEQLESLLGKKARVVYEEFHKADIKSTYANIDKAKQILGWAPETSLGDGLEQCVRWYRDNKPWSTRIELP